MANSLLNIFVSKTTSRKIYIYSLISKSINFKLHSIDGSPPGFPVPGILQARTLEWVAIFFSNAWKWKVKIESEISQSCPTLSDPLDCSLPGSSIHGIFQARVLEWGAIAFSASSPTITLSQHQNYSNESVLCIRWPKYWSFSCNISPSTEYSGLISFRIDWLDLLAIQGRVSSNATV